jgi:galactosamine-6-phosphate isomerase
MNLLVTRNPAALSRAGMDYIVKELRKKPDLILCASAGGTPTGVYAQLAAQSRRQPGLFSRLRVLQIDEWGGLPSGSAASCETDLKQKLLEPLGIGADRYMGFDTAAADPEAECARVHEWLNRHGPIDICLLGLGLNGHVAMNEPAAELMPHPHVARLARTSQNHPMLQGLARKPKYGLSIGMGDILKSRKLLLLVSGAHKREALQRLLEPKVSTRFPASLLWLHSGATVMCDREALGKAIKDGND